MGTHFWWRALPKDCCDVTAVLWEGDGINAFATAKLVNKYLKNNIFFSGEVFDVVGMK